MKEKKTEAEYANLKINQILNDENETNTLDEEPLINNNNIALVIKGQDTENNEG